MIKFLFAAFVACILGLALQSFGDRQTVEEKAEKAALGPINQVGGYVRANYRLDTITNTGRDTFGLVGRNSTTLRNAVASYTPFLSLYTFDLMITRRAISGTPNVRVYLDKAATNPATVTGWVTIDSTIAVAGNSNIKISEITGELYRLRINGAGTHITEFKVNCVMKKKN